MILKFLKQLFCFPHHYEQELSPFDDEWWEDCRKCEKTRKVKKVIIQEFDMQLLYINADFDENGLETKIYESIESFVQDRIGIAYSLLELEAFASEDDEDEEYLDEVFVLNLLKSGSHEGEWSTEEVWLIEDGKFTQGIQEI